MKKWLRSNKKQVVAIGVSAFALLGITMGALSRYGVLGVGSSDSAIKVESSLGGTNPQTVPYSPAAATHAFRVASAPQQRYKYDPLLPAYAAVKLMQPPTPVLDIANIGMITPYGPHVLVSGSGTDAGQVMPVITDTSLPSYIGHVSGIINSSGIRAIYEVNGNSTIVQPGDQLPDGQGSKVVAIQYGSITVHLAESDRDVNIPVTQGDAPFSGAKQNASTSTPGQFLQL